MRNNAEIQIIGYVYQDARCPNERDYPNWVTFKMSVNKKYKDKSGLWKHNKKCGIEEHLANSDFDNPENLIKYFLASIKNQTTCPEASPLWLLF